MSEKHVERVRKLLELSKSGNEHEAAQAAARAAELMSEHAITEAMLEVTSPDDAHAHVAERIIEGVLPDAPERKVAWRDRIACAVARSLDCEVFYWNNALTAIGRDSAVSTWRYTCQYLFAEIARLADEAWLADGVDLAAVGQRPRAWKGAFRLGAADTVANKLYLEGKARAEREAAQARKMAGLPPSADPRQLADGDARGVPPAEATAPTALMVVSKTLEKLEAHRAEVKEAFKKRTSGPGWTKTIGLGNATRGRSGYEAGREAGERVEVNHARGALKDGS